MRRSSIYDLINVYNAVLSLFTSCSPADELDVTPVSTELMFEPLQRKFTVSEGDYFLVKTESLHDFMSQCILVLSAFVAGEWMHLHNIFGYPNHNFSSCGSK